MKREELLEALRRLQPETGSLACLGCGYENSCSIHGCAVIRAAIAEITRPVLHPNPPLPLEELRGIPAGKRVWIELLHLAFSEKTVSAYYIKDHDNDTESFWNNNRCKRFGVLFDYRDYGRTWLAYCTKPRKGDTHEAD